MQRFLLGAAVLDIALLLCHIILIRNNFKQFAINRTLNHTISTELVNGFANLVGHFLNPGWTETDRQTERDRERARERERNRGGEIHTGIYD